MKSTLIVLGAICLLLQATLETRASAPRFRRQASAGASVRKPVASTASTTSVASSSSSGSISNAGKIDSGPTMQAESSANDVRGPIRPAANSEEDEDADESASGPMTALSDAEREPARTRPKPAGSRRPNRRPSSARRPVLAEDDEAGDDCDDYDSTGGRYDYGREMFARPMRQIGRMMDSMFNRMQGMASGDYDMYPGSDMAVASSYSNSDGRSRVSSATRNNGRLRGLVSETRNGRTQTKRIGDDEDDEGRED